MFEDHACQICRAPMAPFGVRQTDRTYKFYCRYHRPNEPPPPQPPPWPRIGVESTPQMELSLDVDLGGEGAFLDFLRGGGFSWETKFVAFIRFMVEPDSTGASEVWRLRAEKWIGPPPDDHMVGAAIKRAETIGIIAKTGNHAAPRDRKSHASAKWEWRRTGKR